MKHATPLRSDHGAAKDSWIESGLRAWLRVHNKVPLLEFAVPTAIAFGMAWMMAFQLGWGGVDADAPAKAFVSMFLVLGLLINLLYTAILWFVGHLVLTRPIPQFDNFEGIEKELEVLQGVDGMKLSDLDKEQRRVLDAFIVMGRKHGVCIEVRTPSKAVPELAEAASELEMMAMLSRAGATVHITTGVRNAGPNPLIVSNLE